LLWVSCQAVRTHIGVFKWSTARGWWTLIGEEARVVFAVMVIEKRTWIVASFWIDKLSSFVHFERACPFLGHTKTSTLRSLSTTTSSRFFSLSVSTERATGYPVMDCCWGTPRALSQFFSQFMQLLQIIICLNPMVALRMKIPNPLISIFVRCTFDARAIRTFSSTIDQLIPWMWLSISIGGAVGLLFKWKIDIGGDWRTQCVRFSKNSFIFRVVCKLLITCPHIRLLSTCW